MTPTDQVYTKCNELYTMTVRTPLKLVSCLSIISVGSLIIALIMHFLFDSVGK